MGAARMNHDPEMQGHAAGTSSPLLGTRQQALIDRLFAECGAHTWGLTRPRFVEALERSARKSFSLEAATPEKLEDYLGALHLEDLAVATACAEGIAEAWEHFVATYRGYLRAAAGAILRCSATSPAACDLADSLFADLYGLKEGKRDERSLFRYFHGRSSLKTWLRAVLAQRQVDAIRAGRRFTELDADSPEQDARRSLPDGKHAEPLADPNRERYLTLFSRTLELALAALQPRDKERLRLYYAEEQTLAEIGRQLGEHESSVSRNLERTRRELRHDVEQSLLKDRVSANGASPDSALSEEEISLCFEYAAEGAPIDFDKLFPQPGAPETKPERQEP
jgi:RNA polymerase sigma factor (sigma-70 family)